MTDLDARYGRRRPMSARRRVVLAATGVGLAVLAVLAFYLWWASEQEPFSARVVSFDVRSDTLVQVRVEIANRGEDGVRCEVVAQDRSTQVVGSVVVEAPPGPRTDVLPADVPTTARAVVAQVRDCAAAAARVP